MLEYSVTLSSIIDELKLKILYMPEKAGEKGEKIKITNKEVNRPGLPLADYFDHFEETRIQIIGNTEYSYLQIFDEEIVARKTDKLFASGIPALVIAQGLEVLPEIIASAKKYEVPVLATEASTSSFTAALISSLNVSLATRITLHAVLVDVYGEGVLMLGESGVGKSETAMELLKRGHRLVADDAVEIKRVSDKTLVGSAPALIRHLIELRGIGIVDVRRLFGIGAIKETESIDLIVKLENWDEDKQYDRTGMDDEYHEILGLSKPCVTIPIKPGRNLAIIIEVAAMNSRQRRLGYNAAAELNKRILAGANRSAEDRD